MSHEISDQEKALKKATEGYREMIRDAKASETKKDTWQYRFRFSQKMWFDAMEDLTQSERIVYLTYCACADFRTGEAIISARKSAPRFKMKSDTFDHARNSLVKKGWLAKTRKASSCWYYKILKIKIA